MAAKEQKTEPQQETKVRQGGDEATGYDVLDRTADTVVYPADIGYTVTSHGDGTPTISPQLVERREELAKFNDDPDRANKEVARKLGLPVDGDSSANNPSR
jgi:hypothetical protein